MGELQFGRILEAYEKCTYTYQEISTFMLKLMVLPQSTPEDERIFSKVIRNSTKVQNKLFFVKIALKLLLPTSRVDPLFANIEEYLDPNPYLGYRFEKKLRDLKSGGKFMDEEERKLRLRCKRFLVVLLAQLKQRLPDNISVLKSASLLSVDR